MRRLVLALLAVLAGGGAFWLRERSKTSSFAPYADAQLDTLAAGYRAVMRAPGAPGDAALDAELSLRMLEAEQHRRIRLRGLAILSLLAAGGALLPGRRRARSDRGEETRLREAMGDPALVLEGERHKAARLLGVTPEAPPEVVEAALAAQLRAHDPGKLDGLAPDLRRVVLERREALQRARDLLLGGRSSPTGTAPQQ